MAEFSPTQLDALEDALEDLELVGLPAELESDETVAARLGDYRDLLSLSREALPLEDVPAGVLASVLAEAAGSPAAVPAARVASEAATPWWKRLGMWIPVLAVGASAALVLVMVRGLGQQHEEAAVVASAKRDSDDATAKDAPEPMGGLLDSNKALQAAAEAAPSRDEPDPLGARGRLRGGGVVGGLADGAVAPSGADNGRFAGVDDAEAELEEEDAQEAPAELAKEDAKPSAPAAEPPRVTEKLPYDASPADDPSPAPSGGSAAKGKKKSARPQTKSGGKSGPGAPASKPKPKKPNAAPSTGPAPSASRLSGADAKRRAGRCGEAKAAYQALTGDAKPATQARALAGLGLCALQAGDESAASNYFSKAKKLDRGVASFIESERASAPDPVQQSL